MKKYNIIVIYDHDINHVLMCKRSKEPYKEKLNFVGGKIENHERGIQAAYRELFEETGITNKETKLIHMMDLTFYITNCFVEIYVGILNQPANLKEEKNQLIWVELTQNFDDLNNFAGDGDISYIMKYIDTLGINNLICEK